MMSSFGKFDGFLCGWNLWRSLLNLIVICVLQHFCLLAGRINKCDGCLSLSCFFGNDTDLGYAMSICDAASCHNA
ncbi:hypothetical protein LDENG_00194220 [Lucifuga dentata]|nr:hypothetical protein LDENG_00194220 [Lucifuga dentata]